MCPRTGVALSSIIFSLIVHFLLLLFSSFVFASLYLFFFSFIQRNVLISVRCARALFERTAAAVAAYVCIYVRVAVFRVTMYTVVCVSCPFCTSIFAIAE